MKVIKSCEKVGVLLQGQFICTGS